MIGDLERALDALSQRQRVLADNVANVNTPGFTRSDVDFFSYMQQVFDGQTAAAEPELDELTADRLDGNNVTLEKEVTAMTQTELLYQAASKFTTESFSRLRYVITEGRG